MPSFPTPEPIAVTVSLIAADVRITASQSADTTVEVRPADPADAADVAAAERVKIRPTDGRLTVKDGSRLRHQRGRVEVSLDLPTGSALTATLHQGRLSGRGRLGEVRATVSRGGIELDHTGQAHLSADQGDITVARCGGPADISTGRGQIRIAETIDAARVGNGAGDVTVERAAGGLRVTAERGAVIVGEITHGLTELVVGTGTIEVGIPDGTAVVLDAKAAIGRVRDDLGEEPEPSGGATVELRAHASHGDIHLHRTTSGETA
ncbi:DUF4097 family beta strand repeat-containing protein [Nonomuraea typhae]|uniref:DUF4097 family beta strand repeat-containing protein n=1 Tax=Nonomuraea typhae TaxID=2603600 RepID=UPI0012F95204|nr:DUF4097 family beta strand repeat-containing protein [Nonomuraea typhae]